MMPADEDRESAYRLAVCLRIIMCAMIGVIVGGSLSVGLALAGDMPEALTPASGVGLPLLGAVLFGGSYLLARRRHR
jgi:hypothetical protein